MEIFTKDSLVVNVGPETDSEPSSVESEGEEGKRVTRPSGVQSAPYGAICQFPMKAVSRLIRNVPVLNSLEVSPFCVVVFRWNTH